LRGAEDFLCAGLGDLVGLQPALDIPTTKLSSFKTQCFTTDQGDCFGFNFAQVQIFAFRDVSWLLITSGKLVVPKVSAAHTGVLDSVFVPHFTYDGFEFSAC